MARSVNHPDQSCRPGCRPRQGRPRWPHRVRMFGPMTAFQGHLSKADIDFITHVESSASAAAEPKPAYPPVAPSPTQEGPNGMRFDFNDGCRVLLPRERASVAGAAARSRHRQHPVRDRDQGRAASTAPSAISSASASRCGSRARALFVARYRRDRPRGADPVSGRHARRHDRLVSLRGEVPGAARLPADLRDGRADSSRCSATPIRTSTSSRMRRSSRSSFYATYSIGLFFDDKDIRLPAVRFPPCRAASHRRLHPRRRPDRGAAADRAPRRHPADRRTLCLHRRAEHDAVQILEQPDRLARDRRAS